LAARWDHAGRRIDLNGGRGAGSLRTGRAAAARVRPSRWGAATAVRL